MASTRADFMRQAIEGFNRDGPEALNRTFHPESVSHPFPEWPDQSLYRGAEGAVALGAQWTELFEDYRWEIRRLLETEDSVVVLAVHGGRARGSGVETSDPVGAVFSEFRDGLVGRAHYFLSWEEALAHAGIPEGEAGVGDG